MSTTYTPDIIAETALIPLVDDYQVSPPVVYHTVAGNWHAESGTAISNGRLHEHKGDVYAAGQPKPQDTYISGTAGRTGRPFTVVSGTVKDDWIHPENGKYGLLMPNGSSGASFEVLDTSPTYLGMLPALVILRTGIPGVGSTPSSSNTYLYLEFNYGDTSTQYRLALEYGRPIRVDMKSPTQTNSVWREFCVARGSDGIVDTYLQQNNGEIRIRVDPDNTRGIVSFELGSVQMRHAPQRTNLYGQPINATAALPTYDYYRLTGLNRWAEMQVFPFRFNTPKVTHHPVPLGRTVPNISQAKVITNVAGGPETGQTVTANVNQDANQNLLWDVTASQADAGDGLGSVNPARLSDVLIYIPAVWARYPAGIPLPEAFPKTVKVNETQIWDDARRMGQTYGTIYFDNANGRYSGGAYGQYALRITASNGQRYGPRVTGIMGHGPEGFQIIAADPGPNLLRANFSDSFAKMERQLANEVILDGVALPTAIRLICEIGQISPKYLVYIPDVGFPSDYANNRYPDWFPHYILGKGTGMNPKYRFMPEARCIDVLCALMQDSGEPRSSFFGSTTPYYMWFDQYGYFHVELYNPGYQFSVKAYSTYDSTGAGQIIDEPMIVSNSAHQLATKVDVIGQDAFTYELISAHRNLDYNAGTIGYQKPVVERNERYASPAYVNRIADIIQVQASLGQQIIRIKVPFDPFVFAGNLVSVSDDKHLKGTYFYTVMAIESEYGYEPMTGQGKCHSYMTLRSLQNSIPF